MALFLVITGGIMTWLGLTHRAEDVWRAISRGRR